MANPIVELEWNSNSPYHPERPFRPKLCPVLNPLRSTSRREHSSSPRCGLPPRPHIHLTMPTLDIGGKRTEIFTTVRLRSRVDGLVAAIVMAASAFLAFVGATLPEAATPIIATSVVTASLGLLLVYRSWRFGYLRISREEIQVATRPDRAGWLRVSVSDLVALVLSAPLRALILVPRTSSGRLRFLRLGGANSDFVTGALTKSFAEPRPKEGASVSGLSWSPPPAVG